MTEKSNHTADEQYMHIALDLAQRGQFNVSPNPMVGCIIVKDDEIITKGWHERVGSAHAEVNALDNASQSVVGATVYVTLEPCSHFGRTPPCVNALIKAQVKRVVIACQDQHPEVSGRGIKALQAAGIETTVGVLEAQARWLNRGFFHRIATGKPWVVAKVAASLDGKTALANGQSKWITSEPARLDVQNLRAASDAIITGVGTVLADDPNMTVRIPGKDKAPLKVIMDRHLRTPHNAKIFQQGQVFIAINEDVNVGSDFIHQQNIRCEAIKDIDSLLRRLGDMDMNYVMLEAGAKLTGAFVQGQHVNEFIVYLAPDILGQDARSMLTISGIQDLQDKISFSVKETKQIGRDLRLTLLPDNQDNT